jgi:CMP/dCMP kinase
MIEPAVPSVLPVIAIDGPAASGKGTLARKVAQTLGFAFLDTGLLYRAVALLHRRAGGAPDDPIGPVELARRIDPAIIGTLHDDPDLRHDETAKAASIVSALPGVRAGLLQFQRDFARKPPAGAKGAVLDGRDIGTVVCPDADAKLFITASVQARSERRLNELRARGVQAIYADVLKDMKERDARDSERASAPLRVADGAFLLDTSALDANAAYEAAMAFIRSRPSLKGF